MAPRATVSRRILLTGASGGLGNALMNYLSPRHEVLGLCHANPSAGLLELDLRRPEPIVALAKDFKPDLILHTVGLTDVDRCDRDLRAALEINTSTTLHARLAAEAADCKIIHISTNDIFDGGQGMYTEADVPVPVNMYARTKLMAEQMFYRYEQSLILRFTFMSWYASGKTTFANWLVQSLKQGKSVTLYTDQFNSPLYVSTLAEWIEALFEAKGIYHLASERRSRYETGVAIAEALGLDASLIQAGKAADGQAFAPRPLDVSLDARAVQRDWGLYTNFDAEVARLVEKLP